MSLLQSHRQTSFEEPPLGLLIRERQGALVGGPGFFVSSQPSQQFAARRVRELIVGQLPAREDRVDEREAGRRAIAHGHGGGAIQFHDR